MSLYSFAYRKVLLPLHSLLRGRDYVRRCAFLERSQWWTRDELLEFQWQELLRLLEWAFRTVPYYQDKYRKAGIALGDIRTREDFAKLPALTRTEINEDRDRLCSTAFRGELLPHATGGSSGTPTRFYHSMESYDWRTAAKDRVYSWSGWIPGEKSIYLWGAPVGNVSALNRAKQRAFDRFHQQEMVNTFSQSAALWEDVYRRIQRIRPKLIVGYVSSLSEFATFLLERGLRITPVEGVIGAAEPLHTATREHIAKALGAPMFNTYGCREFMSLAGECENHDGLHINVENVLIETASPSSQTPSDVLVTDLHNYGMPFIRYAVGDLGALDDSPCACGRGLPRIKSIDGRVLDALRTPDGRLVPGEFFPHLLKELPELRRYQVRQESVERIVISVVLSQPLSIKSSSFLEAEVSKVFGPQMKCECREVESIPRLTSGKQRVTIGLS
jgi:phenylacetate-CoA ligase